MWHTITMLLADLNDLEWAALILLALIPVSARTRKSDHFVRWTFA